MTKKQKRIKELENEIQKSDFWANKEKAIKIKQEKEELIKKLSFFDNLEKELKDLREISKLAKEDDSFEIEATGEIKRLEKEIKNEELKIFLSGKYDKTGAILSIYAGAGGRDAQDWATMLLRMYEKYCFSKGYKTRILDQSFGEAGGPEGRIGIKQVCLEIRGAYIYGFFKRESGVHRLVRISPFSSKSLRHTSFALVEVLPELDKEIEKKIEIRPEELKLETFRSSGPGGQHVNRRESAVRITHLPTGIKVSCQAERFQGLNRQKAMKILSAKLYQLEELKQQKKLKEIKAAQAKTLSKVSGDLVSASWGSQIRSYILYPYKLIKDIRTGIEASDVEGVLEGDLERFIQPLSGVRK